MSEGYRRVKKDSPVWARLEKLWLEEGLPVAVLAQRFDLRKVRIIEHLMEKFGTVNVVKFKERK